MATATNETTRWLKSETADRSGTLTITFNTTNKFVDKDCAAQVTIYEALERKPGGATAPAAHLAISGSTAANVIIGTEGDGVASNYYPVKMNNLSGSMTFDESGWINTSGASAVDTETRVIGRVNKSSLTIADANQSSPTTSIAVKLSTTQTVTIGAGYYNTARTIVVPPMSAGAQASATVTYSKQATKPTVGNTSSAISGKIQVAIAATTKSSDVTTDYYIAMTTTAPATTGLTLNKTVSAGYLSTTAQISTTAYTTVNSQLYYAPLTAASVTVTGSATATTPTAAKYTTDGSNAGVNITSDLTGTLTDTEPNTSGSYYVALTINAPQTTVTMSPTFSSGWLGKSSQITTSGTVSAKSKNIYIPITKGALTKKSATATAAGSGMTLGTGTTTQPSSGKYVTVNGSGVVKVNTAGYLPVNTEATATATTIYYPVATATFGIVNDTFKSTGAGWIDANVELGTVSAGSLANSGTSGVTYSALTSPAIITSDGYLYINEGYFTNSKISLGTLIPDSATADVVSSVLRVGYEAYDTAGGHILGGLGTYDGTYTAVWS